MSLIEVRDLRRSFRSVKKGDGWKGTLELLVNPKYETSEALKGVSFSIEPGSFVGLIGANGAGKTTLLKILSGLIPPTSGEARVLGITPFTRPVRFRKQIALVMGQKAQLWWDLPAIDAFELLRAIYEIPLPLYKERLKNLTELLDVEKHLRTQIRRLSLGERMKMELIGALLHWPSVIFLDEPTIGLDVLAAHKLREFLKVFNEREKATIILTSHNMDDIQRLCSRMILVKTGEIIYDGAPSKLMKAGERTLRVKLLEQPSPQDLARLTGVSIDHIQSAASDEEDEGEARSTHFQLSQDQIVSTLQKVMSRYTVVDMGIEEQSLEAVIQRIYEGKAAT